MQLIQYKKLKLWKFACCGKANRNTHIHTIKNKTKKRHKSVPTGAGI